MHQIKFYRTSTLPTEDTTGSYEVGSLYFYHNDTDGYNELYLCKSKTEENNYEFENYSGLTVWESSLDTSGGGSGSDDGSGGDSPVIPDSGTITNVGDGKITINIVNIDDAGVETTDEWSFSVNQSNNGDFTLSLADLGGVSQYTIKDYLPLIGGIMTGMIDCSNSNSGLTFGDNTIQIDGNGSISVNTSDSKPFNVNTALSVTGVINSDSYMQAEAFYETSDARKKDIKSDLSLDKCYDLIDKCQTVIYSLKDQTQEQVGMIAQEIEEFFPEVVATDADGFKSLAYDRLVVICFKVLKDVIKRLEKLES